MQLEWVSREKSFLAGFDPRGKVAVAILFVGMIALLSRFEVVFSAFGVALFLIICARLPSKQMVKRLALFNIFILFSWVVVFTYPGRSFLKLGFLDITVEGLQMAVLITLKANTIFLIFSAMIAGISLVTLGHALRQLGAPEKLVHLLLFTYRYMHVLEKEFQKLYSAAKIRGFSPSTNMHTYRTFAYLIGMLLVRSISRAERIHEAMICRGYHGKFYSLHRFSMAWQDVVFLTSLLMVILSLGGLEWGVVG